MKRGTKIVFWVFFSIILVVGGIAGGLELNQYFRNKNIVFNDDPPILLFPVENIETLELLYAYNMSDPETGHNGIDFIINFTANIIASCNMTVNDKVSGYNEDGGFYYAGVSFDINDAFELLIGFENFNESATAGEQQLNALVVEVGQVVTQGELIGQLLYLSPGTHIHYSLQKNGQAVCPYLYFNVEAKGIFDNLWLQIGSSSDPCNGTLC